MESNTDQFEFLVGELTRGTYTKRSILSCIAKIFDPLGLLAPVIIIAKMLIQKLWEEGLNWDEALPLHLRSSWHKLYTQLPNLNHVRISRRVICDSPQSIELHGFSDSSERAYGACIYIRALDNHQNVHVKLLCAKSRVAPLKSLTIPKLELCGALLLIRLMKKILENFSLPIDKISYWCDSTVVLGWLKTPPNVLKIFVGHRVAEIQGFSNSDQWNYVRSEQNPADLISRGVYPNEIRDCINWWIGPSWLSNLNILPMTYKEVDNLPELRKTKVSLISSATLELFPFKRFSKFNRMLHTVVYIHRFLDIKRKSKAGPFEAEELEKALTVLIRLSQKESFPQEYNALSNKGSVVSKSRLAALNPFLHSDGTLRVGGRLEHSEFNFDKKHPFIIDAKHYFVVLLFRHEHHKLLHASGQLLLTSIRERFWPIRGRNLAKLISKTCIRCFRAKPPLAYQPMMGNLPKERVIASFPFQFVGVDFAGPYSIQNHAGRGCRIQKCYIALFVCFTTKALHLELVTSL